MKIKVYGCRGSAAVCCPHSKYGGNTSCMAVVSGGELLILDAGSGLMAAGLEFKPPYHVLLSHLHLDHIIGLAAFGSKTVCYTCSRDERPLINQLCGVFVPPYWPVSIAETGVISCVEITAGKPFNIGVFTITPFNSNHPDNTLAFSITDGRKKLVYLLDSETAVMSQAELDIMGKYCGGADLIVFDATYSARDYPAHKGWGHSTVADGVTLAARWGCKRMLFSHFSQKYSDSELDKWDMANDAFILACEGLELEI